MSKNILLGCAAAFVVVGGAHAADLPVKAKPVEYVKICSAYGAGFFYVPGTDTCIKIGGWVRAEYTFQTGNGDQPFHTGAPGRNTRIDSNEYNWRARWVTSIDVRTQTEYGTLRAYSRAGFQTTTGETAQGKIYTERGFIQFAGFTLGKSQSYFDFFGGKFCYGCTYQGNSSTTDGNGTLLAAYSASFGNGFTATLSLEDQLFRRGNVWDASNDATNALVIGNVPGPASAADSYQIAGVNLGDTAATGIPDIVGSLRVDQAWGSAQIAGALHQLRAGYYGNNTTGAGANVLGVDSRFLSPNDAYGWAAMAGIVINLPWAKGDKFWIEGTVAHGAGAYAGWTNIALDSSQQLQPLQRRERGRRLGDGLHVRHARVDERRDGPAADQLLLDRGGPGALLDAGTAERLLRQLQRRGLQRHRDDAVLLVPAEPDPPHWRTEHAAYWRDGGCGLQPRFQRVERRRADDLESGAAIRCRRRSHVYED